MTLAVHSPNLCEDFWCHPRLATGKKKSHLQRRELSFNDLKQRGKQRGLRLLPTTIGASFSPDAVMKRPMLPSFEFFATTPAFSPLRSTGSDTLSLVHLNDHPSLTEFLDWRDHSLGLPSFHWCCTFFPLAQQAARTTYAHWIIPKPFGNNKTILLKQ